MLPDREATLSPDGVYRYTLGRRWSQGSRRVVFVMLNPSTADANIDDPTIRKCVGFAKRWGFDALTVVNLWAFRTSKPAELMRAGYPVGPDNDRAIASECATAERVVVAWGSHVQPGYPRVVRVVSTLRGIVHSGELFCLGLCDNGSPRHPLMLAYETPAIPFRGGL
jgi:hypothetical protein